jgi:hypothetical protein
MATAVKSTDVAMRFRREAARADARLAGDVDVDEVMPFS